jgi:GT2 family glycosyltransferase
MQGVNENFAPEEGSPSPMQLSVIITCQGDVPGPIAQQLEALAVQDFEKTWELLIADNGASPATRKVIDTFRSRIPTMRLLDVRDRSGQAYAANTAVQQARSDQLVFLDSDDIVAIDYLRHVHVALSAHDFIGARLDSRSLNSEWLYRRRRPLQEQHLEILLNYRPAVVGAGMSMTREAFNTVGGFDESLMTQLDVDLSWRLDRAGFNPCFVPEAVVHYRYRQDMRSLWRQEFRYGIGEVGLYVKHRGDGVPRRLLRSTVRGWLDAAMSLPRLGSTAGRARLATAAGAAAGRLVGSIRHKTFYL